MESKLKPARTFAFAVTIAPFAILETHYDQRPSHRKQKSNHGKYCETTVRPVGEVTRAFRPVVAGAQESRGANAVAGKGLRSLAEDNATPHITCEIRLGKNWTGPGTSLFVSAAARTSWEAGHNSKDEGRVRASLGHLAKLFARNSPLNLNS
jgi:hypothetical protein